VDFGYTAARPRSRWFSARIPLRLMTVTAALSALALVVAIVAIRFGDYPLTTGEVLGALTGAGDDFPRMIVVEWRLPIAVAAVVFGALLGVGGATRWGPPT
jgi:iron complex transport system permease protein